MEKTASEARRVPLEGGFTLIELLVVVAIVAVLASLAYPAYLEHARAARRAEARSSLLEVAAELQRCQTRYRAYNDPRCAVVSAEDPRRLAAGVAVSVNGNYRLRATRLDPARFTLRAEPVAAQAGDRCGAFIYRHTGAQDVGASGAAGDGCW